jgi:hypothetical protein
MCFLGNKRIEVENQLINIVYRRMVRMVRELKTKKASTFGKSVSGTCPALRRGAVGREEAEPRLRLQHCGRPKKEKSIVEVHIVSKEKCET